MSLAGYTTAVERSARGDLNVWVEIEGLPYAYGTHARESSWFSSRAAGDRFEGIRSWLAKDSLPTLPPQELDHAEGSVSGGAMVARIDDVDGSLSELTALARTDGRCVFAEELSATAGGSPFVAGDTATWPASGVAYIGYETIAYSSKTANSVTISARGRYRSRARVHDGGNIDSTTASNGSTRIAVGALLTPWPQKLEGRRVWLMAGHSPASDADCTEVWSGVIEEAGFDGPSLRTLVLSCSQAFGELKQPAFSDLGTFGTDVSLEGGAPVWVIASRTQLDGARSFTDPETYRFGLRPQNLPVTPAGDTKRVHVLTDSGRSLIRLGAAFDTDANLSAYLSQAGFAFTGAEFAALDNGGLIDSPVHEAVLIDGAEGPFSGVIAHPLGVLLQLMLSDQGDGGNSASFDNLPPGFGLGIDSDRVDVAGILAVIEETRDLKVRFVVDRPVEDFGEWARTYLLKPFGFFLRPSMGNKIGVGRMRPPGPVDRSGAAVIDTSDVIQGGLGGWTSDIQTIVGHVVWRSGYVPEDGEIKTGVRSETLRLVRDARTVALDWPKARTIEVDGSAIPAGLQSEAKAAYLEQIAARFTQPVGLLDVAVDLRHAVREVGEFVSLTHPRVPSRYSATRGVSSQLWEVVSKQIDLARAVVNLRLRQTAVAELDTRYLAPAMLVDGAPVGSDVTIDQTAFVASGQDATDAFAVGDYVRAYDPSNLFTRSAPLEITGISGAVVTLNDATPVSDGAVLIHADYSDWDVNASSVGAQVAFRGTVNSVLIDDGTNTDDPHDHA